MVFIDKKDTRLGLIYAAYIVIAIILYYAVDRFIYRWLAVNSFLACLSLVFSTLMRVAEQRGHKVMRVTAVALWLIFFPNAPYMITDMVHIPYLGFSSHYTLLRDVTAWLGLIYITIGVILGIITGLLSLDAVMRPILKAKGRGAAVLAIAAVSVISGYAVYIGRFLRFNSWDLFFPVRLTKALIQDFSLFTVSFSLLIAAYIAFSYLIFYLLYKK